jgi:metal-dependent amidase/aminoacylase/carboxypeptidase family protein
VLESKANMASESHCLTASVWPGVYAFVGIYDAEKGMTARNHNECFEPDEDALPVGAACHIAYAVEFLKNGPDTSDRIYKGDLKEFFRQYNPPSLAAYGE